MTFRDMEPDLEDEPGERCAECRRSVYWTFDDPPRWRHYAGALDDDHRPWVRG